MKNKQQSTARALRRRNKIVVEDKTSEAGFRIVNVPKRNRQDFINRNKKRRISDEELQETRLANPNSRGQFQKGLVPWNKGTKGIMKANSGTFKKGNMPSHTAKADGEIRIRYWSKKSKQDPQKYIRISLGKWQLLSHYTWEKAHGPMPHGCIIAYKDGDTMNCELDNLMLMTRAENMERNSIQRYPPELKFTIKVVKRLKKLIEHEERKHERLERSPLSDH